MAVFNESRLADPVAVPHPQAGLQCRYWQGDWRRLWLDLDQLKPQATGNVARLWDYSLVPSDNPPLTDKPAPRAKYYAVEYSGFLRVPADGVYTLHAPHEFVWPDVEAGYDLRVWLGNRYGTGVFANRVVGVNEWYPSTRLHALGNWSVALKKGLQPFRVVYIDYRTDAAKRLNVPGLKDYVWTGATPDLRISGPGIDAQPIPAAWLMRGP